MSQITGLIGYRPDILVPDIIFQRKRQNLTNFGLKCGNNPKELTSSTFWEGGCEATLPKGAKELVLHTV